MEALVEYTTGDGARVLVAVDNEPGLGVRPVSRPDGVLARAHQTLDEALHGVKHAAEAALGVFREGSLRPDGIEIEFGVRLTAETGAVIARTAVEGHMVVRLSWRSGAPEPGEPSPAPEAE